ncbi:PREDICTED: uncharacterized protein LOC108376559 [Rhagoletis zephyria]|uniref:uncharacterized protein LOC108376559 n=1 Tax=Rhagoletis zephyria TaxID=28612 RepID=UPI00081151F0|nr:PREDICTED: uncharacterized protein LOC108376559 [Rhagoletis zephyria]
MWILKTKLKGSAASCIANLQSTSTNFNVARNLLNERFTNKRLLANTYFKNILETPVVIGTAFSIRSFQEKLSESAQALGTLGLSNEEMLQALLCYILVQKLDNNLRLRYENSLTNSMEIPDLDSLQKFLNHERNALEAAQSSVLSSKPQKVLKRCTMGCNPSHPIFYCQKFNIYIYLEFNTQGRWDKVILNKLCSKFLRPGHSVKECKNNNCRACDGIHYYMLHKENEKQPKANSVIVKSKQEHTKNKYRFQNSVLGWHIYRSVNKESNLVHCVVVTHTGKFINDQLRKFWEIEAIENKMVGQTIEERKCEEHFEIDADGNFIVGLPLKAEDVDIGDSSLHAKRRFFSL